MPSILKDLGILLLIWTPLSFCSTIPLNVFTICKPTEIGIGTSKLYSSTLKPAAKARVPTHGTIFDYSCSFLASTASPDPWQGGWHDHYTVTSKTVDGQPFPTEIQTPSAIYGNCYIADARNCDQNHPSTQETRITHCCSWSRSLSSKQSSLLDGSYDTASAPIDDSNSEIMDEPSLDEYY